MLRVGVLQVEQRSHALADDDVAVKEGGHLTAGVHGHDLGTLVLLCNDEQRILRGWDAAACGMDSDVTWKTASLKACSIPGPHRSKQGALSLS